MEHTSERQIIGLLIMLACFLAMGRMEQLEAEELEQSSVQVAQK